MKFALSIEEEYRFLRQHVLLWYNPKTNLPVPTLPVTYLPEGSRKYTPDFLIRHKETKQAFLIEVKTFGFNDEVYVQQHKILAEAFKYLLSVFISLSLCYHSIGQVSEMNISGSSVETCINSIAHHYSWPKWWHLQRREVLIYEAVHFGYLLIV